MTQTHHTGAGTGFFYETWARLRRPAGSGPRRRSVGIPLLGIALVLSLVAAITDAGDLTSSGTFGAALRLAMLIALVGLGGLWAERAGVVNIGLEGMMILGTWFGAYGGSQFGAWQGVALGIAGGAIGGLLHAIATVWFGVDHIVSGVAINLLGAGVARYLSVISYKPGSGGGATQSPSIKGDVGTIDVPFLAGGHLGGWKTPDLFGWLERKDLVVVSDIGGMLRGITGGVSVLVVLGAVLFPLTYVVLWRTAFGLRLRACGEDPYAAESLGVNVYRAKTMAVVISGAFAGLAGTTLVYVFARQYSENQTAGRGFIGLAAMIFGNWRPGGLAAGAGLFGFADALQLRDAKSVHALLLLVAIVLLVIGARSLAKRSIAAGLVAIGFSLALGLWWATSDAVPSQLVGFTPHLTTLVVLTFASQRLRPPAADGLPYRKGGG